jgi:hypothetical protein
MDDACMRVSEVFSQMMSDIVIYYYVVGLFGIEQDKWPAA